MAIEREFVPQELVSSEPANDHMDVDGAGDDDDEFWTVGPEVLYDVRVQIAAFSVNRAKERVQRQRNDAKTQDFDRYLQQRRSRNREMGLMGLAGSKVVSTRGVSSCQYSPNGKWIAVGSWAGDLKILDKDSLETVAAKTYRNWENNKVCGIDWSHDSEMLIGGNSNDMTVVMWKSTAQEPCLELAGHEARISATKFHPTGNWAVSASYDQTWRFWDLETATELYLQEGHSKGVHAISLQHDGALLASGGLDGHAFVWDLRTGKQIAALSSHSREIMCLDWSRNGYQLATGSKDCTVKVWDLRYMGTQNSKPLVTIPAHTKLVSDLEFCKGNDVWSDHMVTSSYDGTVKVWSADNWICVNTLKGHTDKKVMCVSIDPTGDRVASGGWDRAVKVYDAV